MKHHLILPALFLALAPAAFLHAQAPQYVVQDLGTLGGGYSESYGINNAGQVTGYSSNSSGAQHAFLYSGGSMSDLGTLGGDTNSTGFGINNAGQVTGSSDISGNSAAHAFLYSGGNMYDLNNLVGASPIATDIDTFSSGHTINDWGQITAQGTVGGQQHAVLLNPVKALTSTSGSTQDTKVVSGMNYNLVTSWKNPSNLQTTVQLLDGIALANRDVVQSFTHPLGNTASDVLSLSSTGTDTYVLQMSYDEATAIALFGSESLARLGWLDPNDSTWKNSVLGNTGGTPFFAGDGVYNSAVDFHLGYYGVDTVNNDVWAVINHNSSFAVTGAPEPGRMMLLVLGGASLVLRRRRARD